MSMTATNIVAKARTLAGPGGLEGIPVANRVAFVDEVKNALPGATRAEVREALLAAWSATLETKGRDASAHPSLARRILDVVTGHKPAARGDGTFSPVGAQIANKTPSVNATNVAKFEPLLHQGQPLIEGTAMAVERLGSIEAVDAFKKLPQKEQDAALLQIDPKLDLGGHSGSSFSYAVTLGKALLGDRESLSAALHNDGWLKQYVTANTAPSGEVAPRVKPTAYRQGSDGSWEHAPDGKHTVNIAQSFDKLPPDWQAENLAAAMAVRDIMRGDPPTIAEASAQVHVRWLSRPNNAYAKGGALDVPYAKLTVDEKIKDVEQVLAWAKQTAPERVPSIAGYIEGLRAGTAE